MAVSLFTHTNICLSVDEKAMDQYFNKHDPAPLYERQFLKCTMTTEQEKSDLEAFLVSLTDKRFTVGKKPKDDQ